MDAYQKGLCSICCLGYCHAQFLQQCIHGIWSGDYRDVEIIVVDDGSLDNSVELLNKLVEQSPFPMTVIAQENTGNVGKNLNRALQQAKGEYVTFISLDDVLCRHAISKKIELMSNEPLLAFVANTVISTIDDKGNVIEIARESKCNTKDSLTIDDLLELEYSEFNSYFYMQGAVFRSDLVRQIGGYDEDMTGDDIVFCTKLLLYMKSHSEYIFKLDKNCDCYYRMHDHNLHKNIVRQIKIVTECLQRYWPEREIPETLIEWGRHAIRMLPFKEFIKIFSFNNKAASMLLDVRLQNDMLNVIYEEYDRSHLRLTDYMYRKNRYPDGRREIILFSFIRISYRRKK